MKKQRVIELLNQLINERSQLHARSAKTLIELGLITEEWQMQILGPNASFKWREHIITDKGWKFLIQNDQMRI